jgi:hypothetical protein
VTPLSKVITLASLLAVGAAGVANAQSDPLAQQVQICSRNDDIAAPFEQPPCTTHRVASEPLGSKTKATLDTINHGLGNGDLFNAIGARTFRIDDDADLIVDQVVCIVGKVWIYTRPRNPSRLWISQRHFLGRLASTVAGAPANGRASSQTPR